MKAGTKQAIQHIKKIPWVIASVRSVRRVLGVTPQMLDEKHHKKRAKFISDNYFSSTLNKRKLHIGCQTQLLKGWLNVDIQPKSDEVMFMDATQSFPFADESFDYIYSEHMIEHISYSEGAYMIQECFRCLKKNGILRIATPDFDFLIGLAASQKSDVQSRYIKYSVLRHMPQGTPENHVFVVNNFFKDWGHKFIYDFNALSESLKKRGFEKVQQCSVGLSTDINLQSLEHHGNEIGEDFNKLETMVLEARK